MRQEELGTYQMLWDCPACGTSKLLGLDHRHCPACGSPQDSRYRYYPSDADKVLVQNHQYVGADRVCPGCSTPSSAAARFCAGCGAPLEGDAREAVARGDQLAGAGQAFVGETVRDARHQIQNARQAQVDQALGRTPAPKKRSGLVIALVIGGIVAVIGSLVFVLFFWKREAFVEVEGHAWTREIAVETFGPTTESAWCSSVPSKARVTSRRKEVKDTKKVPDGEECKTRRKDNRDGTFKQVKECTPKYKEEPIYAEKCTYEIDKWHTARTAESSGQGKDPAPSWPEAKLGKKGNCKGCEREGERKATYTLRFVDKKASETYECEVDEPEWTAAEVGSTWKAEVGVVTSKLDCDSFQPMN
jgi:hypothetical protein